MFARAILLAAASIALSATPAMAAGDAARGLQAMKELNLIVLGNMTGGHDVEGKVFVGGSLGGNSMTIGSGRANQGAAASDRSTLTVGGALGASNLNLNNGSNGGAGPVATNYGARSAARRRGST